MSNRKISPLLFGIKIQKFVNTIRDIAYFDGSSAESVGQKSGDWVSVRLTAVEFIGVLGD
jgi:hypothetical protein